MNLESVKPAGLCREPDKFMPELLSNIILKSSFDRNTKDRTGWLGFRAAESRSEAFTAKISAMPGVYGIDFSDSEKTGKGISARFPVCYFPQKDEDILEVTSFSAALATNDEGYSDAVRDFPSHEIMGALFHIGVLEITVSEDEKSLYISYTSPSRKCLIPVEGIINPMSEGQYLVKPGEYEERVPAAELCSYIFDAIVRSVSASAETEPAFYGRNESTGSVVKYLKSGESMTVETDDEKLITECIGFGREAASAEQEFTVKLRSGQEEFLAVRQRLDKNYASCEDKDMDRPGLIILSGFLGSGKSTLLANMIEHFNSRNEFVAVIQNELGDVSVDTKLIYEDYSVIEMDEGCVCCSLIGNLSAGLQELREKYNPSVIILETTGAANPANILCDLDRIDKIVRFQSLVTVVDTPGFMENTGEFSILKEQVRYADTVILNKTDLCGSEDTILVRELVREMNPNAEVVESRHCRVNPEVLFRSSGISVSRKDEHHNHSTDHIESMRLNLAEGIPKKKFLKALESLDSEFMRIKGIVRFDGSETNEIFQYVSGNSEFSDLGEKVDQNFLIFLGRGVKERIPCSLSELAL